MNTRLFFWLLRRKRFYFSLAFIGLLVFAYDFLGMRQNDFALRQHLQRNPFDYEVTIGVHKDSARKIRYAEIGDASKPLIVFIHGAPSSISFWETMLTDSVLHLPVDHPDYQPTIKKMIEIVWRDVPMAPLYQPYLDMGMGQDVEGYAYFFHRLLDARRLSIG
mgnify:CR=1 FL=1